MFSLGDGIALAGLCGVIITTILRWTGNRKHCSPNSEVCVEHSGLVADIKTFKEDIHEIKKDVKTLLERKH